MVLDVPGGLFGQKDVREGVESVNNKSISAVTQWTTNDGTGLTSYVDVTNATVNISGLLATKTYTAIANSHIDSEMDSAGKEGVLGLDIEGTTVAEVRRIHDTANRPYAIGVNGLLSGITGVTSITAKLIFKTITNNFNLNKDNLKKEITLIVLEE